MTGGVLECFMIGLFAVTVFVFVGLLLESLTDNFRDWKPAVGIFVGLPTVVAVITGIGWIVRRLI